MRNFESSAGSAKADSDTPTPDPRSQRNSFWIRYLPRYLQARISGRYYIQAIVGNSGWLFTDRVLRMAASLVIGLWVARYLGPDRFGLLKYAAAFTALFGAFASLGLDAIVVKKLVNVGDRQNVILGSAFALKILGALSAIGFVMLAISLSSPHDALTQLLVAISAAGIFFQSSNVIDFYFQARLLSKFIVYATNSAFLIIVIAKAALILTGAPLVAFAWAGLAELVFAAAFRVVAYRINESSMRRWRCELDVMLGLLRDSWPLLLSSASILVAMRIDQIMIGQMLNAKQVGIYSAAVRISEIWYFVPLAISNSTFPLLVKIKSQSEAMYYQRLQQLYNALVLMAIAVALAMSFLSGPLIKLLYGGEYRASAGVLSVLVWSGIPVSFGCAWSSWMLIEGRTKMMLAFQLNSAVVNIVLNIVLIPRLGILGSAYATLISYSLGHTVLAAIIKSQRRALFMLCKTLVPIRGLY